MVTYEGDLFQSYALLLTSQLEAEAMCPQAEADGCDIDGNGKRRALVVCTHLRLGRRKRRSRYLMQPISGLHIGSLIDQRRFDVRLYHEDWHGPFDPAQAAGYDLVFLTGLQADFDRMRQLSYIFRRAGSTVIAGGSICTLFPDFAAQFFDAICVGGVDNVVQVVEDYERGSLKSIYRSPADRISHYTVDYSLLAKSGISPSVHLVESSRGCSFRCTFCIIPAEIGGHAGYGTGALAQSIDSAIATSPLFSFRRWYPMIMLLDNNFSDDRDHMLRVIELLASNRKIRGWSALVTQNILHDRPLIQRMATAKCIGLFAGLESFDQDMLRRYNKTQNLGRRQNVVDDILFAESQGIAVGYGYLFDPRFQTATEMERQIRTIARTHELPMPTYLSVVAPLAGTESFWADLNRGHLATNLRLRDLDGETIGYSKLADTPEALVDFVERMFRRPWTVVGRFGILLKTLRRLIRARTLDPVRWYVTAAANLHWFIWSSTSPSQPRTYLAGSEILDPQYFERPVDLTEEDYKRYFEPIALTDCKGQPAEWLKAYIPQISETKSRSTNREEQAKLARAGA
jgi:radical SAM superfamily enzyme YgiQ (UPF0313 family)